MYMSGARIMRMALLGLGYRAVDEECGDEQAPLEFLVSLRAKRLDGDVGYVWTAEHSLGRMGYPS